MRVGKNLSFEGVNYSMRIAPGRFMQPGLPAGVLQKHRPVPSILSCDLRQQQSAEYSLDDIQSMLPHLNLFNILHTAEGRQNGNFYFKFSDFILLYREKSCIFESRTQDAVLHDFIELAI